jgi:hypothetical protein
VFDDATRCVSFVRWDTSIRILATHTDDHGLQLLVKSRMSDTLYCGCRVDILSKVESDTLSAAESASTPLIVDANTLVQAGFVVDETTGIWSHPKCYRHVYRVRKQRLTYQDLHETSWLVRGTHITNLPLEHMILRDTLVDQSQQVVTLYVDVDWSSHTIRSMSSEARTALASMRLVFEASSFAASTFALQRA